MKRTKHLLVAAVLMGACASFGGCAAFDAWRATEEGAAAIEETVETVAGVASVLIPPPFNMVVPGLAAIAIGMFGRKDDGK